MSRTVSMPANLDFSLFQSGADTTPREVNWGGVKGHGGERTIEKKALQSLFDVQLCVEYDQPEADGKCVVAGASFEDVADGEQGSIMGFPRLYGRGM